MRIDPPGKHEAPGSVDHLRCRPIRGADSGDRSVADSDVDVENRLGSDDAAAGHDEVHGYRPRIAPPSTDQAAPVT